MKVNLVLIGPPGSGKGTQAVRVARRFAIPHISTGDILRQAVRDATPLGVAIAATIARGELVGDALITDLVRDRLGQPDTAAGFILDGFPRTTAQAEALDGMLDGSGLLVVLIEVIPEAIVQRLSSRRVCQSCRLTQSVSETEEGMAESCPYCGGRLVRRDDDAPGTVRHRLATYAAVTGPVLDYYRNRPGFLIIDGMQEPDAVTRDLIAAVQGGGSTTALGIGTLGSGN